MRRVVVTGLGMVTPLGCGVDTTWTRILDGESGAKKIDTFEVADLASQIACVIPRGDGTDGTFNPDQWMEPKEQRKVDDFIIFAMAAARQALDDANWHPATEEDKCATGTLIGSGIGGLSGHRRHRDSAEGARAAPGVAVLHSGTADQSRFRLCLDRARPQGSESFRGDGVFDRRACDRRWRAPDRARRCRRDGGGRNRIADLPASAMAGFCAARALSTGYNETPQKASRPYDKDRDGFVMGEGAGVVVLEEYEHAKKRGAKIYAEVIGYGLSGDAYHITSPAPDGDGGFRSMSAAMKRAGIAVSDIDYINAHGTSTQIGDEIELGAVERLLGNAASKVSMSSTKSSTGHLLGAAGAIEAIFSILAIRDNVAPPTINLDNPSVETAIDLVPQTARKREINVALSNSFGFGGTNASVIVQRVLD